jgi:exonuclease III
MIVVGYNCRGLGNGPAVRGLLSLKRKVDPDVLFLAETKLHEREMERFRWLLELPHMCVKNPEGRSRGVAMFWKRSVDVILRSFGRRHIDVDITREDGTVWRMTGVYGESQGDRKHETWRMMRALKQQHQDGRPWLCLGDFNEILSNSEKQGGVPQPLVCMDNFKDALHACDLVDIGFEGDPFTWRNNSKVAKTYICERLDRATANTEWCTLFPSFRVVNGEHFHSDHRPVIVYLEDDGMRQRPNKKGPFRFEARWLQEEGCDGIVEKAWKDGWDGGVLNVSEALKSVASNLQGWDETVVGDISRRIKETKKELEQCLRRSISKDKVSNEVRLRCKLELLEEMENIKWKQRAHAWWLREGDRNTRYFHAAATTRKKNNLVKELRREDGSVVEAGRELTSYVLSYFQELFTSNGGDRIDDLIQKVIPRVTEDMNKHLVGEFTRNEVKAALDDIGNLKAPGPDGMQSIVYKRYWNLMGDKIVDEVLQVLNGAEMPEGWNDTFVTLIPKVKKPNRIKDLRPISLCNVLYKIVSKVLANRLKSILPEVISGNQSAFVPGRLITDNVLIAYELSHYLMNKRGGKEGFAAVKADMSKAYDRVEWKFLEEMMKKMGSVRDGLSS